MLSAISAIRSRFSMRTAEDSASSMMRGSDASRAGLGNSGGDDEVSYAGLNGKDGDMSLDMMKDSLTYDYSKAESENDKKEK